jgi:hypothetical protein
MSRTVPAVLTTAVLAVAAVSTAATPARWALLAVATVVFHFAYLLYVMLGALLGLRDVRWLGLHLPGVVWGVVGLVMTKRCPVTLLEKLLWEKAGRTPYDGTFLQHYVFGMILPESSQGLVYWAQAGLVVGVYVLAIRRHLLRQPALRGPSPIVAAPIASRPAARRRPTEERLVPLISVEMIDSGSGEPPIGKTNNMRLNRREPAPA